jgi:monoamine oxidase
MKEEIEEETELDEALTRAQRIKRSQIAKRNKAKIQRALQKAKKKRASTETLQKRAMKKARDLLYTKLLKGRDRSEVSAGEQERIEKKLDKMQGGINRIAKKLLPQLKKAEQEKHITEGFKVGDTVNIKSFSAKTNRDGVAEVKIVDITKTVSGKLYVHYKQDGKVKKMDYKIFKQKIR